MTRASHRGWWLGLASLMAFAACGPAPATDDEDDGPSGSGQGAGGPGATGGSGGSGGSGGGTTGPGAGNPECVPDCSGLSCGPDPNCGQSCGTCGSGTCDAGQCSSCQAGETACIADINVVQSCNGGQWSTSPCPEHSVCAQGSCRPVCDGYLATQTKPSACIFPMNENGNVGAYFYTNDTEVFQVPNTFGAVVWDGGQDAPVAPASSGASWPWAWQLSAFDDAIVEFNAQGYPGIIYDAALYFEAKKTLSAWTFLVEASANPNGVFGSGTISGSTSWSVEGIQVGQPLSLQWSENDWNAFILGGQTNGATPSGVVAELGWYMVEITPGAKL